MEESSALFWARLKNIGLSPFAPGTMASLFSIVVAYFLFMPLAIFIKVLLVAFLIWFGFTVCDKAVKILKNSDPKEVVFDEFVGQLIVILPFTNLFWWEYIVAFGLFRFFDIYKPWLIAKSEELPGGIGVMMDDLVAGLFAMSCLGILHYIWA